MKTLLSGAVMAVLTLPFAQAQDTTPSDFNAQFRGVIGHMLQHEYEDARPLAEALIEHADSPAQHYRARHVLTDISARLGHWKRAIETSSQAYQLIIADEALSQSLILNASHMAAEEGRAQLMMGHSAAAQNAHERSIATHPDAAPGWQANAGLMAVHSSGLSCPLMREGYLRFDLIGGSEGVPGCVYWNLEDIGVRVFAGAAFDAEDTRLANANAALERIGTSVSPATVTERIQTYDLGAPTPFSVARTAIVYETPSPVYTVTVEFPQTVPDDVVAQILERALDDR